MPTNSITQIKKLRKRVKDLERVEARLRDAISFAIGEFQRENHNLSLYIARQIEVRFTNVLKNSTPPTPNDKKAREL